MLKVTLRPDIPRNFAVTLYTILKKCHDLEYGPKVGRLASIPGKNGYMVVDCIEVSAKLLQSAVDLSDGSSHSAKLVSKCARDLNSFALAASIACRNGKPISRSRTIGPVLRSMSTVFRKVHLQSSRLEVDPDIWARLLQTAVANWGNRVVVKG